MANNHSSGHTHNHSHAASRGALLHIISAFLLDRAIGFLPISDERLVLILHILIYIYIGYDILFAAIKGIFKGHLFDENFLITIATLGVFALAIFDSSWGYDEAIEVMLFFKIGEYLQGYASIKSIEKVQALGYDIKNFGESKSEAFITRFARIYTPFVCFGSIALAIVAPISNILMGDLANWETWIYRALTFLVISCPCAMVISIPLTFFASIIGASKKGILIADGCNLETVNKGLLPDENIVFTDGNPDKIAILKRIAHKCMSIVWQNIVLAVGVKIVILVLSALGITNMWLAIFADTGIMIIAVLNALRAMYVK